MTLTTFAENNRLTVKKDDCGDAIIQGKYGHIYEYGSGKLGVCITSNSGNAYRWNRTRAAFIAAGMELSQNGHDEGCATFDPTDATQARTAMVHAKVRVRRRVSPKTREAMMANLARARQDRQSIFIGLQPWQEG
jgi:hypothetical protein